MYPPHPAVRFNGAAIRLSGLPGLLDVLRSTGPARITHL